MLILVAIIAFSIGARGFSDKGLPLTKTKNLSGIQGRIVGGICVLIGILAVMAEVAGYLSRNAR